MRAYLRRAVRDRQGYPEGLRPCFCIHRRCGYCGSGYLLGSESPRLVFGDGVVKMRLRLSLIAILSCTLFAQQPTGEKLAPYYPTPQSIVERMLDLVQLKPGEKMFDLGSGDGRIVIMAAQKYRADATGVELDQDLVESSTAKIRQLGLEKN